MMWNYKRCPRCSGDTYVEECFSQLYEKCLQCGYEREITKQSLPKTQPINKLDLNFGGSALK